MHVFRLVLFLKNKVHSKVYRATSNRVDGVIKREEVF